MPTIRVNRQRLKKVALTAGSVLAVLALLSVSACWFFGIRSRKDIVGYREMLRGNFHPVWKDMALRRIKKGDDLNDFIRKHPPPWREDYSPSYVVLRYGETPLCGGPIIAAKDSKLIFASIGTDCWEHVFFDTPEETEALDQGYSAYLARMQLENEAYRINVAIETGNDVFLARLIERSQAKHDPGDSEEGLERLTATLGVEAAQQLLAIYGPQAWMLTPPELQLTVEVTEALQGDLTLGARLTFPGNECRERDFAEPQTVFLHLPDSRMLFPFSEGGDVYLTVSRNALDWYRSLTEAQMDDIEARYLDRRTRYMQAQKRFGRTPPSE